MTTTPPHNLEAEQAVLGAILIDNEAFYRVAFLEPGHFFEPLHQTIFHISANLIRDGKIASPVSVKLVSERIGLPADLDIGGLNAAQYLALLAGEAATIGRGRAGSRGRMIYDLAVQRRTAAANLTISPELVELVRRQVTRGGL